MPLLQIARRPHLREDEIEVEAGEVLHARELRGLQLERTQAVRANVDPLVLRRLEAAEVHMERAGASSLIGFTASTLAASQ